MQRKIGSVILMLVAGFFVGCGDETSTKKTESRTAPSSSVDPGSRGGAKDVNPDNRGAAKEPPH